jgi:hypothetical protein
MGWIGRFPDRLAFLAGNGEQEKQHEAKDRSDDAPLMVIGVDIGKDVFHSSGSTPMGRLPSGRGSGDWVSKTPSRSGRGASSAWKPA